MSSLFATLYGALAPRGAAEARHRARWIMALEVVRLRRQQESMARIAALLGISVRSGYRLLRGNFALPGRPRKELEARECVGLEKILEETGGRVSIAYLKSRYPQASRRAIGEWKKTWLRKSEATKRAAQKRLHWQKPGRVWALDGTHTPKAIEGKGRQVLVLRDVASGYTLAALPAAESTGDVLSFLRRQFAKHGEPLVLKTDNGSSFKAQETQDFLAEKGVTPLLSPPHYPQYNGSIERSMQDIKAYAEVAATLSDREGKWLQEDLEKAVLMTNDRQVERAGTWQSPAMRYATRDPISDLERALFQVESRREVDRRIQSFQKDFTPETSEKERQKLLALAARLGVTRALETCGYLTIEEGRVSPPVSSVSCDRIIEG